MYIVEVFVTNASLSVNQLYSYYYDEYIEAFKRVEVSFAKSKTRALAINSYKINSLEEKQKELGFKLLKIINVIDENPIISKDQFDLALWLSKTTISPLIACINTMLPKALRTSKTSFSPRVNELIKVNEGEFKFTVKQKEIYDKLKTGMLTKDARSYSVSIFNKLVSLKAIEIYYEEKAFKSNMPTNSSAFKVLTDKQKNVYNQVLNSDKNISLLFGITGSGKTEVYLHLAKKYIEEDKEVLILVPEISLTPQMISRVKERFNDVIFYHSELSDQERYEQYKRVLNQEVKIVVGTRSSVFLPFKNLGLIIIDEEHDQSYKQDNTPCYSAINVAKKLANNFNAKLLLASATPSLDSYTRALNGEYNLLTLDERINHKIPNISIIDLVDEIKNKSSYIISNSLKNELEITLNNNKQAIILLNRRGYSPIIKCTNCGSTLMCSSCDVPLNYHKDENLYKCHECGRVYKATNECPSCKSHKLIYYGFGTKKVEEELHNLFPKARIERMDRDNVSRKGAHEKILNSFGKGDIDILIGTQMIAKGLDYPNVTLVGILNADSGLMHQDYNSSKITFDLLMQASGRSGRADDEGKVLIQAFNSEHYALKAVLNQDYKYFYNIEMNYRYKLKYPPYSHMLEIIISDLNENRLNTSTNYLFNELSVDKFKVFKPVEINKVNNLKRNRILVMSKDLTSILDKMWKVAETYLKEGKYSKIKIDIDPLYLD